MRDRHSPFDTRSSAILPSAFCFPSTSVGQLARAIPNPTIRKLLHHPFRPDPPQRICRVKRLGRLGLGPVHSADHFNAGHSAIHRPQKRSGLALRSSWGFACDLPSAGVGVRRVRYVFALGSTRRLRYASGSIRGMRQMRCRHCRTIFQPFGRKRMPPELHANALP